MKWPWSRPRLTPPVDRALVFHGAEVIGRLQPGDREAVMEILRASQSIDMYHLLMPGIRHVINQESARK